MAKKRKSLLDKLFMAGIMIKAIDGILELIVGIALIFIRSDLIVNVVQALLQQELIEDPKDLIANYFIQASHNLSASILSFVILYLIIHGAIKIGISLTLWFKKRLAYPIAGIVLSIFVIYQFIRVMKNFSMILLFLTLVDVVIIALLRYEYLRLPKSTIKK